MVSYLVKEVMMIPFFFFFLISSIAWSQLCFWMMNLAVDYCRELRAEAGDEKRRREV